MNEQQAREWLAERDCYVSEYDGETFVIVECQYDDPVDDPLFEQVLLALGIDEADLYYQWGYSDNYTTCSNCCEVIRTSPTHACWTPDYWVNIDDGEILCQKCTKENSDDYFAWLAKATAEVRAIGCVLRPLEDYGFTKVVSDLRYGLHPGESDDPHKLITWAHEHNFEIAFDVSQNPFTTEFDVYLRKQPSSADKVVNVEQVRKALLVTPQNEYSSLRSQFRQYPTPAMICEVQLKGGHK